MAFPLDTFMFLIIRMVRIKEFASLYKNMVVAVWDGIGCELEEALRSMELGKIMDGVQLGAGNRQTTQQTHSFSEEKLWQILKRPLLTDL